MSTHQILTRITDTAFLKPCVDVVIGTHPHVLEPVEVVSDTKGHEMLVYYSLGNFVSNQDQASYDRRYG